jgi:ABC-type Fe3+-hydroxamate transport system substrate-binding protein
MTTDKPGPSRVPNAEALLSTRPTGLDKKTAAPAPRPRTKPTPTTILVGVVAALALFAGGTLLGNHLSSSSSQSAIRGLPSGFPSGRANGGGAGANGGGGFTAGEISAAKDGTLTITTADGTSVTVKTSSDTTVTRSASSDVASLAVGEQVTVIGPTADGAVTAQAITEGTSGLGFGGAPGGQPSPAATAAG